MPEVAQTRSVSYISFLLVIDSLKHKITIHEVKLPERMHRPDIYFSSYCSIVTHLQIILTMAT